MYDVSVTRRYCEKRSQPQIADRGMSENVVAAAKEQIAAPCGSKRSLLQKGLQRFAKPPTMQENALLYPYVLQYSTPMSCENERL